MIKKLIILMLGMVLSTPAYSKGKHNWSKNSGIRMGYNYINAKTADIRSPHMFALGFEMQQTLEGGSWLDILFVENVTISGLDQSKFAPSFSTLVGFEIDKQVQLGVGPNLALFDPSGEGNYFHIITGVGYTADAGIFSVPIHLSYIPDINKFWRIALTTGVNW